MTIKHPDYDIDFKPAIARFDWDQTYDVLEFVYLPQGFSQLMDLCGIPCFELMAIDRFTPYRYRWADQYSDEVYEFLKNFNFSPHNSIIERFLRNEANQFIFNLSGHPRWENGWVSANSYVIEDVVTYNGTFYQCTTANSDTNFTTSKWKLLTYRNYSWSDTRLRKFDYIFYWDIISDISAYYVAITDNAYLKPPIEGDVKNTSEWIEISLTVPKFELKNTQVYNYEPILANFTKGKYQITGLIYQGSQEGLTGSIPTINQTFAEFTLAESTEIDLNQILWNRWLKDDYFPDNNTNRFCSNSLVISKLSNGNWVNYTPSFTDKPTWLLFDDINTYFNNVKQQLIDYFQTIFDDFSIYNKPLNSTTIQTLNGLTSIGALYTDEFIIHQIGNPTIQINNVLPLQNYYNLKLELDANLIPNYGGYSAYITDWELKGDPPFSYAIYGIEHHNKVMDFSNLDKSSKIDYNFIIEYIQFPDYFINDCYLARANNNKWSMQTNYGDLGDIKYNKLNFDRNTINKIYPFSEIAEAINISSKSQLLYTEPLFIEKKHELSIGNSEEYGYRFIRYDWSYLVDTSSKVVTRPYSSIFSGVSFSLSETRNFPLYAKEIEISIVKPNYKEEGKTAIIEKIEQKIRKNNNNNVLIDETASLIGTSTHQISIETGFIGFREIVTSANFQDSQPINFNETLKNDLILFAQHEWEELYNENAMTDQEYLDYLLQLKEQYEEMSKTW